MKDLQSIIENAWDDRSQLTYEETISAIREVIDLIDEGSLRVAEPTADGWQVNEWVKKAVVLYFPIQKMETHEVGIFEYHDNNLRWWCRVLLLSHLLCGGRYGRTSLLGKVSLLEWVHCSPCGAFTFF